jgi:hypothetical protein
LTSPARIFPDTAALLKAYFETLLGPGHAGTKTPDNLAAVLPFVRVQRAGGSADGVNDHPTLHLDVFGDTYADTNHLAAELVEQVCGRRPPVPQIDEITCTSGPSEQPYAGSAVRRFHVVLTAVCRRVPNT